MAILMVVFWCLITLICNSLIYDVKFHFNNDRTEKHFPSIDGCRYFVMRVFNLRGRNHHGLYILQDHLMSQKVFSPFLSSKFSKRSLLVMLESLHYIIWVVSMRTCLYLFSLKFIYFLKEKILCWCTPFNILTPFKWVNNLLAKGPTFQIFFFIPILICHVLDCCPFFKIYCLLPNTSG